MRIWLFLLILTWCFASAAQDVPAPSATPVPAATPVPSAAPTEESPKSEPDAQATEEHPPTEGTASTDETVPGKLKRSLRPKRVRATLPKGVFGAAEPESPKPADTTLGGTVPEIWSIPSTSLTHEDEMTPLFDRDTLVPAVSGKILRYATMLMQHYDENGDGILQEEEWKKMPGAPQAMDVDGDLKITLEELLRFLTFYGQKRTIHRPNPVETYFQPRLVSSQFQLFKPISTPPSPPAVPPATPTGADKPASETDTPANAATSSKPADLSESDLKAEDRPIDDATYEEIVAGQQVAAVKKYHAAPEAMRGVPMWFLLRDKDGDGQISIPEFAPTLSPAALALFGKLDKNGDGFITPDEVRTTPEVKPSSPNTQPAPQ